jgi:uncharacterized membrane protein
MAPIPRQQQTTRLETFVDAAFAFALTMLVVSVDAIPQNYEQLVDAMKRVPAFAASFAILVMFWHGHYRWSRRFGVEDTGSVVLSLLLVFLVLVFLYPLRLMMSGALSAMTGGWLRWEFQVTRPEHAQVFAVLYGLAFALMAGVLLLLNARVRRRELSPPLDAVERSIARVEMEVWGILAGFGATSALLAATLPARFLPLAVWLYAALAIVMPLMSRRWRRMGRGATAAFAGDATSAPPNTRP